MNELLADDGAMTATIGSEPPQPESITDRLHARFHWDAIRLVCRSPKLARETRRVKLRFLVDGLKRTRRRAPTSAAVTI